MHGYVLQYRNVKNYDYVSMEYSLRGNEQSEDVPMFFYINTGTFVHLYQVFSRSSTVQYLWLRLIKKLPTTLPKLFAFTVVSLGQGKLTSNYKQLSYPSLIVLI